MFIGVPPNLQGRITDRIFIFNLKTFFKTQTSVNHNIAVFGVNVGAYRPNHYRNQVFYDITYHQVKEQTIDTRACAIKRISNATFTAATVTCIYLL